jgi:hypothetical protein
MSSKFIDPSELLRQEIERASKEESQAVEEVEELTVGQRRKAEGLAVFIGLGLSKEDIDEAKSKFKRVYSFIFDEDHAFLYRSLTKQDFDNIISLAKGDDEKFKSLIVRSGTIWPSATPESLANKPAGIGKLLFELIMAQSGFVDLGVALQSVIEL